MSEPSDLAARIEAEFAAANERLCKLRDQQIKHSDELQKRLELAQQETKRLAREVIRPRMKQLLNHFDNAELVEDNGHEGCHCTIRFRHTSRFPATTTLRIGVTHDDEVRNLLVEYSLEIIPIFMDFERSDQLSQPWDQVDEDRVAAWIEDKLVTFTKTYLQLEFVDQYQRDSLVTEPVARTRIPKIMATATAEFGGHTWYFLNEENKQRFLECPELYIVTAQRGKKQG